MFSYQQIDLTTSNDCEMISILSTDQIQLLYDYCDLILSQTS